MSNSMPRKNSVTTNTNGKAAIKRLENTIHIQRKIYIHHETGLNSSFYI